MPNFQANSLTLPDFPAEFGDTKFIYKAISKSGEILIYTVYKDEKFFIQLKKRRDGYLVKGDKITRPSQVVFLQNALKDFRDLTNAKYRFSNIEYQKRKSTKKYKNVVDIDYFSKDFEIKGKIYVEVGFGSGRHLLYQAKQNPDKTVIGIEIHKPSLEQVAKQCELQNLDNVLLLDYDARIFLEFLSSNSVEKIFVHFPVPWDKKPHRRVICEDFINESVRVLDKDGTLELRTDSENYFRYSCEEFLKLNRLSLHVNKNRDLAVSSKYEDRWKRLEKNIYDVILINDEISADKPRIGKLEFHKTYDFSCVKNGFKNQTFKEKDSFVHLEDIFEMDSQEGILKLSFGSSSKNERAYILFSKDRTEYFPNNILASKSNVEAHKIIKEWLDVVCSQI